MLADAGCIVGCINICCIEKNRIESFKMAARPRERRMNVERRRSSCWNFCRSRLWCQWFQWQWIWSECFWRVWRGGGRKRRRRRRKWRSQYRTWWSWKGSWTCTSQPWGKRRTWERARKGSCQDYEGRARTTVGSKVCFSRSRSTDSTVHSYTRNPGSIANWTQCRWLYETFFDWWIVWLIGHTNKLVCVAIRET